MKNERICKRCQQIFILSNIAYEKRGGGKYCSMECSRFATKTYTVDELFFHKIDSDIKAYWLGFCFADAYNSGDELIFQLSSKDKQHLSVLIADLSSDQKIREVAGKNPSVKVRFGSRKLCQDLISFGCIPKKSKVVKFPIIDKDMYRHFIRGVFDGDGCLYIRKNKQKTWSLYSESIDFIRTIKSIIEQEIGIQLNWERNNKCIATSKKESIKKLNEYFYLNSSRHLERKREKFLP
jgi:intein/homing endonuclease